ncbi:MAG: hypothetical protein CM15mP109_15430 [Candidatus Dadabacteria bacterium]|nr:MAG: hypothetical protein CM15mP109_15430 [Candidatus Dadabacteria bacterium]
MPADLQTKLLRVLENSVISKVGSNSEIRNSMLGSCAQHIKICLKWLPVINSANLLFRLNVFPIDVPNLSERNEDIPEIIEHFIERKAQKLVLAPAQFFLMSSEASYKIMIGEAIFVKLEILWKEHWFSQKAKISDEDVKKYLLRN